MKPHSTFAQPVLLALFLVSLAIPVLADPNPIEIFRQIDTIDDPNVMSPLTPLERNFAALNSQVPKKLKLDLAPWADGSWRMHSGLIASRYADSHFTSKVLWTDRHKYILEQSPAKIVKESNIKKRWERLDTLSAAEKYDLLVGDSNGTLASAQWREGEHYISKGTMASWMGICEGSAAASAWYPEPKHAVDLKTAAGDTIRFHILDIKGLAALLWSSYNTKIPISGSRCPTSTPEKDQNGVVIDPRCFNSNPGTFHIALLNFIGLRHLPFFMNRSTNTEVWNVPVVGYDIEYTTPVTPIQKYKGDRFIKYRSPNATSIVEVNAKVLVASGLTGARDTSARARLITFSYQYDLELDSNGQIVGGEWMTNTHPDFLWAVDPAYRPRSIGDQVLGADAQWDGGIVPAQWLSAIQHSSGNNQPLELIVRKLVELSQ